VKKKAVEADLTELREPVLACRDFKHAWSWVTDFSLRKDAETKKVTRVTRELVCVRCGTIRHDEYELPSFDRIKSTYEYTQGYLIPGSRHIPVSEVRQEILRRFKQRAK
jgi:hypothetical protein